MTLQVVPSAEHLDREVRLYREVHRVRLGGGRLGEGHRGRRRGDRGGERRGGEDRGGEDRGGGDRGQLLLGGVGGLGVVCLEWC